MSLHPLERRLRQALAGTSEAEPRPMSLLELPLGLDKLLAPKLRDLRAAAVLVPVMRRASGLQLLLTRRADHLRAHKGQVSFPGGRRDPEDTSIAANALREAQEEIGLDPRHVEVIGYLDDYPTLTRYRVTPVVGIVSDEPPVQRCEDEVAEIFEVPLEFVLDARSYQSSMLSREGLNLPFYELHHGGHRIWGATAGMLWNLQQKVEEHGG